MDSSMIGMLLLQVVLIALNAVFASAEIAVISVNENKIGKMAQEGNTKAKKLEKLVEDPAKFLATIQVAITLSGFLGSAFAADNFSEYLVDWIMGFGVPISRSVLDTLAVIVITIILSYFTLVFGELVPKQVAMRKKESLALGVSGLITTISKIFAPLVALLTLSTNGVLRLMGIDPNKEEEEVSEEEILLMAEAGSEKGIIDHEEKEWIENVFEFDDLSLEEVMTHRKSIEMLNEADPLGEWETVILNSTHSSFPIFKDNKDTIIGVLDTKKYFRLKNKTWKNIMDHAVKKPYFVPENMKADVLFRHMKKDKEKVAVVLDEYGGVSGIVTMNDLIEELVGDLNDDEHEERIEEIGMDRWKVIGNASLEMISDETGIDLENPENDTLNGLIYQYLDRVPEDGERCSFDVGPLHFDILQIKNHQVRIAIITKKPN